MAFLSLLRKLTLGTAGTHVKPFGGALKPRRQVFRNVTESGGREPCARTRRTNMGGRSYVLFDGYALERSRLPESVTLGKLENHGGVAQW